MVGSKINLSITNTVFFIPHAVTALHLYSLCWDLLHACTKFNHEIQSIHFITHTLLKRCKAFYLFLLTGITLNISQDGHKGCPSVTVVYEGKAYDKMKSMGYTNELGIDLLI